MQDFRDSLGIGTQIKLGNGSIFEISGEPIGFGGGSIIYPANRLILKDGSLVADGLTYALKECYPVSMEYAYTRNSNGEISPRDSSEQSNFYLHRAQQFLLQEGKVSGDIYKTASRMLPIRESSEKVTLTLPGKDVPCLVANTVTVMDSLSGKGQSIRDCLRERDRFAPAETFRIIQQLLFALREVHQAGYLHLDIQDGNIFLRGALEDKSELVTLIDFGSARTMVDGKTAPIEDRVIFTSRGFSAPEMLLCNDGTLQLTPEADIYSVGCLTLYLLTGRKAESSMLLANKTGRYLRPNDIRRMHCPRHLVERIQEILAKALEKEPTGRYHSVDEMLEDVNDLVAALQPYRTDLNTVKYDAFVCYKHGAIDSKAAMTLQRKLEQFRAPKGVAHSRRPFKRVFVDEGELSSCADFGEQIREALKNAGWLVVICSPNTPVSPWVQLEIDTFLEYHDRSRILAVLTDGEPENAFPPQLLGKGGTDEVLAADARGSDLKEVLKKLNGDALLKIAAPMMGTTFDTLKQRQRVYLLQRIVAIATVFLALATGFAVYALDRAHVIANQSVQIQQEHERALINESKLLTERAEEHFANNDPLGALEWLLAALPSESVSRPLLTETEYALGKALGIYKTPTKAQNGVSVVGIIDTDHSNFFLNEAKSHLFAYSNTRSGIQIWDTESLSLQYTLFSDDRSAWSAENLLLSQSLLVSTCDKLVNFDYRTGKTIWEWPTENMISVAITPDKKNIVILSGYRGSFSESEEEASIPHELTIDILDANTCDLLYNIPISVDGDQYVQGNLCVSSDLRWAAISTVDEKTEEVIATPNSLYLIDLMVGRSRRLIGSESRINGMLFHDGSLVVLRTSGYTLNEKSTHIQFANPITVWSEKYELASCDRIWSSQQRLYSEFGGTSGIMYTHYDTGASNGEGFLFNYADQSWLINAASGETIREYKLKTAAMDMVVEDNGFKTLNADGSCTTVRFDSETVTNKQYLSDWMGAAAFGQDEFFVQRQAFDGNDSRIWKYAWNQYDRSYVHYFTANSGVLLNQNIYNTPSGDSLLLTQDNQIVLFNLQSREYWVLSIPEEYGFSDFSFLGASYDGGQVYWAKYHEEDNNHWMGKQAFYTADVLTGEIHEIIQPKAPQNIRWFKEYVYFDEKLMFAVQENGDENSNDDIAVYSWDLKGNMLEELCRHPLSPESNKSYQFNSMSVDESEQRLYFAFSADGYFPIKLIQLDLQSGKTSSISVTHGAKAKEVLFPYWEAACCRWNRSGTQAVFRVGGELYIANQNNNSACALPVDDDIISTWFALDGESVFLLSRERIITHCRTTDGQIIAQMDLKEYYAEANSYLMPEDVSWEYIDEQILLICENQAGFLMDISSGEIKMKAVVEQCFDYNAEKDLFFVSNLYTGQKTTVGSFPRHTTEDLIQMANKRLGIQD